MIKKLIFFTPYLAPWNIYLLNFLNRNYNLFVVMYYVNAPEQKFNISLLLNRVEFRYKIVNGFDFFGRQIRFGLKSLYEIENPDIVISHEFSLVSLVNSFYKLMNFYSYKHYVYSHDNLCSVKKMPLYRKVARSIVIGGCDGLIVYTPKVKKYYQILYPKLTVMNCPNIQSFTNLNIENIKLLSNRNKLLYNLNCKKIHLYVGRLVKVKGVDYLIKAFHEVADKDDVLVIIGEGDERQYLEKLIIALNRSNSILMLGRYDQDSLYSWYMSADLFILPSIFEPFGAVVDEALHFGLPVLCSKYAGASMYIDSSNGMIFDPLNLNNFIVKYEYFKRKFILNKTIIVKNKYSFTKSTSIFIDNL